ncbi:MAG: RNA polymerase factor sigma-32 [Myxococcales bacterium]|nr:RNA polymerase factor sigma-32 [Myxococcales bacterium]
MQAPEDPDEVEIFDDVDGIDEGNESDDGEESEARRATLDVRVPAASAERLPGPPDALGQYMAALRGHAPISREEEHQLAVRWIEEGDREAARQLVLANLRLVVKIAMEYRRSWTNALDLIQEGNLGLVQAVQRFDPYQGTKLSSYAVYWIRAFILKYLIDNIRMVRMGSSRAERKLFFRLNKEKRLLESEGFKVEPKLLAERLDVSEDDVLHMEQRLAEGEVSLSTPLSSQNGQGAVLGDLVDSGERGPDEHFADAQLRETFMAHVRDFAAELEPRERAIVDRRVLSDEPATLQELGTEFGVSRERVRQIERRVVDALREYLREKVVDFEYYAQED